MGRVLTIDLGTTYFKAALFDRAGSMLALRYAPTPIERTQPGLCEVEPHRFREAIQSLVAGVASDVDGGLSNVRAVSFATQSNSFVVLDGAGEPLTPIILWPDHRAMGLDDEARSLSELPGFRSATGVPALGGEFMLAKLLWLRAEKPDLWQRTRKLCLISDYLTLWLTGHHVTEGGAAGLTGGVDIHRMRWWLPICMTMQLDTTWLPAVARAGTDLGAVRMSIADEFGLPRTCRFVVGCLDQYAGAIGAGNIHPGGVSETTGTVLASVRCAGQFNEQAPSGVFQGPAFSPNVYYQMIFGSTSAGLLEAYRNALPGRPDFAELDRLAAEVLPGAEGLRLKPDASADDVAHAFAGTDPRCGRGHETRAILEAVAHTLADQVDEICEGQRPPIIHSSGGSARSDVWLQIKADIIGSPFAAMVCPEPTSLGAAMLAARAVNWGDLDVLARTWAARRATFTPDPGNFEVYTAIRESRRESKSS